LLFCDGLIRDAVIVGENRSEIGALVWLSDLALSMPPSNLSQSIAEKLNIHVIASTGSASRVLRMIRLRNTPDFDKGEITEKRSLNQRLLRTKYTSDIDKLYSIRIDKRGTVVIL